MRPWWKPIWTRQAGMRALRATLVVPALFAICLEVVGDPQMTLFATFGGFATLVVAGFGGSRKDKLAGHVGLALVGSLALIIGTLVSGTAWIAAVVTIPVTFTIFFAGITGPNAASGTIAAMFAYVLPVVSVGGAADLPSRLEGWWLASAAGTIAVLLLSPPAPANRLRAAVADLSGQLASRVRAAAAGEVTGPDAMSGATDRLRAAFTAAPYRPTGLAASDQALGSMVQLLEWSSTQVAEAFDGHIDLTQGCPEDRELLLRSADLFSDTQALLTGQAADPDFDALESARAGSAEHLSELSGRAGEPDARLAAAQAVHAQALAVVARSVAADALIVSHRASPETIETARRHWYESPGAEPGSGPARAAAALARTPWVASVATAATLVRRHASIRSVWFLNSLRAAVALAAAVAVADASGVQHAFWVVLGTLSVLRTSASATGSTAWRGLAGTVVGFVIGAALLVGIGTNPDALWAVFPVAVLVAAYAPGTTPFLVGQAAFTVTVVVLFNLLDPVGWTVGLLRVEDVAIGCGVSFAVGLLLWPRGVVAVVSTDLADAFRSGAAFLTEAVDWALSEVVVPPAASVAASSAGIRLDDAVRGFLTEQGSKRLSKEDLWTLVNASTRLRLTAHSLATLRPAVPAQANGRGPDPGTGSWSACVPLQGSAEYAGAPACTGLRLAAGGLAGFYDAVANEVSRPGAGGLTEIPAPSIMAAAVPRQPTAAAANTAGSAGAAATGAAVTGAAVTGAAVTGAGSAGAGSAGAGSADGADGHHDVVTESNGGASVLSPAQEFPHPHLLWVQEHLHHLSKSAQTVSEPALHMGEIRSRPWWR